MVDEIVQKSRAIEAGAMGETDQKEVDTGIADETLRKLRAIEADAKVEGVTDQGADMADEALRKFRKTEANAKVVDEID